MEEQWQVDRAQLRSLRQQHPDWSYRQLAEQIGRSRDWVKKWCQRFNKTDPTDENILKGYSRRPKHPPPRIAPEVVERIVAIRDQPPGGLNRTPGPVAIKYYLQQQEQQEPLGHYLPRSTSTIWRILDQQQRIWRPSPKEHEPMVRAEPLEAWQIDFKDVTSVAPQPEGKRQHTVEVLNIVDTGTSILIDNLTRADFNAETVILTLTETLQQWGCPRQLTFDRDPRFVGSWSGRDYPSALVRFLTCLGIAVDICPPQRPDKNAFVERYQRSYEYEGIQIYLPSTVTEVIDMNRDFKYHYNYQRPNQALTCANQPPRLAFPDLPQRPALPQLIDPDSWLQTINGKLLKRRIDPGGRVKVDKHRYYIGQSYQGRYVVLRVEAETKQFSVELANQPIKTLPIKGLHNQPLRFEQYLKLICQEAVSEWRLYQQYRRYRIRLPDG
jgi:hypothetical protein